MSSRTIVRALYRTLTVTAGRSLSAYSQVATLWPATTGWGPWVAL